MRRTIGSLNTRERDYILSCSCVELSCLLACLCAIAFFSSLLIDGLLMVCSFVVPFSCLFLSWSPLVVWSFGSFVVAAAVGFRSQSAKKAASVPWAKSLWKLDFGGRARCRSRSQSTHWIATNMFMIIFSITFIFHIIKNAFLRRVIGGPLSLSFAGPKWPWAEN